MDLLLPLVSIFLEILVDLDAEELVSAIKFASAQILAMMEILAQLTHVLQELEVMDAFILQEPAMITMLAQVILAIPTFPMDVFSLISHAMITMLALLILAILLLDAKTILSTVMIKTHALETLAILPLDALMLQLIAICVSIL
jgi:hypothetical protein